MLVPRYSEIRNQLLRESFPNVFAPALLRDADSNYVPLPIHERLVQCIWYDQRIQHAGHLHGNAGTHEHDIDTCEHRAVQAGEDRKLDLVQEVDPDDAGMALLGEIHLDEVGQDQQPLAIGRQLGAPDRNDPVLDLDLAVNFSSRTE